MAASESEQRDRETKRQRDRQVERKRRMLQLNYPKKNVEHPFELREYDSHRWQHQDQNRDTGRQRDRKKRRMVSEADRG